VLQQEKVLSLIEGGLAAICMHTNLDEVEDGVDDTLVETLGLTPLCHLADGKIGHVSQLPEPMDLQDFLALVQQRLGANGLRYLDGGRPVQRVATGCGSCGEYLREAAGAGCDTFLTGDLKYNVFLDAQGYGMNLIDAGHFATENPIVAKLGAKLQRAFPEAQVEISQRMVQPDQYFTGKKSEIPGC
jgi:putative NIF3 family GTP cyclohydrolase 1 type 2